MTTDAALDEARAIINDAQTDLTIELLKVEYTAKELNELADRLLGDQGSWANARGIGGGFDPLQNRVILQVDPAYEHAPTLIRAIESLEDPRVVLELIDPIEGWAPESRVDDHAPWTAGAAIDAAAGGCTLGWTWKTWGSGQVVGSTALHCVGPTWTNSGTFVGTILQSNASTDSVLINGATYSPTVFVGNQTTTVIRRVVSVDAAWNVGDSVAMSGRTTGLNVTTVKLPTYTLPSCAGSGAGLVGVLVQSHVTAGGDSGGPWLTTLSGSGYAVAHGQHYGYGCASGHAGSFFIKLNSISAAQSATILLY